MKTNIYNRIVALSNKVGFITNLKQIEKRGKKGRQLLQFVDVLQPNKTDLLTLNIIQAGYQFFATNKNKNNFSISIFYTPLLQPPPHNTIFDINNNVRP